MKLLSVAYGATERVVIELNFDLLRPGAKRKEKHSAKLEKLAELSEVFTLSN